MPDIRGLLVVIAGSLLMYIDGYYDKRQTKELKLHNYIKIIYGKYEQSIYVEPCVKQTIGLILALSILLEYLARIQGIPILVSARAIVVISVSILALAMLLDYLLDRIHQWLW
jgi:hypothetical protein